MPTFDRFSGLVRDARLAARRLGRHPGFTLTAVLTLALGIGASTAIFTVVDSTLLRPLNYRDSAGLVALWERVRFLGDDLIGPNPRHAEVWRKRAQSFAGISVLRQAAIGLATGNDHPQLAGTVLTSPNLFDVLQVTPMLGRKFVPDDGIEGRDRVVVVTYNLWRTVFHSDPRIIGRFVRLGDVPREVIGVLPEGFHFPNRNSLRAFQTKQRLANLPEPSVFVPLVVNLDTFSWNGEYGNWIALARLKPGRNIEQAQAELNSITALMVEESIPASQREEGTGWLRASIQPLQEAVVGQARMGLWLLMAAVLALMLIACVNLANTQLARTLARHRDASIRAALGAPAWRLISSLLMENLILSAAGGLAGTLLASVALDLFRVLSPVDLPRLEEVQLNQSVIWFAAALVMGAGLFFSVLPALSLLGADPQAALTQNNSRAVGVRQGRRFNAWLIGLQVAGCTALLLVTVLFSRNLLRLVSLEKGFDTKPVAFAQVNLSGEMYGRPEARVAFIDGVLAGLRSIPGVQVAGYISAMPLEGETFIEGLKRVDRPSEEGPLINLRWASPGYFETMGHKLVAGRFFEERDRNLNSVVLSESEAKALWRPGESSIGGVVSIQGKQFTVIGVVGDSRNTSLLLPPPRVAYLHYQHRTGAVLYFTARGIQAAGALAADMREAIWTFAPDATVARAKPMDAQVNDSLASERFHTFVLTAFGVSALLLAMLGIYGVLSYAVASRRREIGVRMALGASRASIYKETASEISTPVLAGLATGLLASLAAGRVFRQLLGEAAGIEASSILIVAGLFLAAAVLAAWGPARRAASLEPMEALRPD